MSWLIRQVRMRWHTAFHWLGPADYRLFTTSAGTIDSTCSKCIAFFCDMTERYTGEWCPDCKHQMTGIEYRYDHPEHWDGMSEWECPKCGLRIGRFTGKRLSPGQYEPREGRPA